jgi:predicted NAD/FAD-binding protein
VNIAIIGSGISGLSTAWFLKNAGHKITIFEKEERFGGHATEFKLNYHNDKLKKKCDVKINPAFDIFNKQTYPMYIKLLKELGVDFSPCTTTYSYRNSKNIRANSDKTWLFPVFHDLRRIGQLFKADFTKLSLFSKKIARQLNDLSYRNEPSTTFKQFLSRCKIPEHLINTFYIPLFARPWGVKPADMSEMPVEIILDWLHKLSILTPKPAKWYKNSAGTSNYINTFVDHLRSCGVTFQNNAEIKHIVRLKNGVKVELENTSSPLFDEIVLATNARIALKLLKQPLQEEAEILSKFKYQKNLTLVHSDSSVMPRCKKDWSYFNIIYDEQKQETMNTIHFGKEEDVPVFLTNYRILSTAIDNTKVHAQFMFEQPIYNKESLIAQGQLAGIQGNNHTWFAGVFCKGHGHHESGVESGFQVAQALLKDDKTY